jgi:hypothetical protein
MISMESSHWRGSSQEGVVDFVAGRILKEPQISTSFNRFCHNPLNRKQLKIGNLAKSWIPALGAGGPQFKSGCPDHLESSTYGRRCPTRDKAP